MSLMMLGCSRPSLIVAGGSTAHVQVTNGGGVGGGTSIATSAFGSSVTSGNAILVAVAWGFDASTVVTISDTGSNTYSSVDAAEVNGDSTGLQLFYAENITGGSSFVVTGNFSTSVGYRRIIAFEVSGVATSGSLDQHSVAQTGGTATPSIGPVTTTTDGQYCFGVALNTGTETHTYTAGSGWTHPSGGVALPAEYELFGEYLIQASAGNVTAEFTKSGSHINTVAIATFKAA